MQKKSIAEGSVRSRGANLGLKSKITNRSVTFQRVQAIPLIIIGIVFLGFAFGLFSKIFP